MGPGQDVGKSTAISLAANDFIDAVILPAHPCVGFTSMTHATDAIHAHLFRIHRLLSESTVSELMLTAGDHVIGVQAPRSISLQFHRPIEVVAVGSVCQRTTFHSSVQLDVVLDLAPGLFQKKDYLDRRYFARRALYLDHACRLLSSAYNVSIVATPASTLLPCLKLECRQDEPHMWRIDGRPIDSICVLTQVSPDLFVARRLAPLRNALRSPDATIATPFYNQVVLHEMYRSEHVRWLRERHDLTPELAPTSMLVRRWLQQRHIELGGFIVDVLVAYLGECGRIVAAMTSWQMFRATLFFLSEVDLRQGVAIAEVDEFPLESFADLFSVTFLASCGRCNLLYTLPLTKYVRVRHEAQLALRPQVSFSQLFLDASQPSVKFDAHFYVKATGEQLQAHQDPIVDRSPLINLAVRISDVLVKAYSDRIILLDVVSVDYESSIIRVGLLLNESEADRVLDRGPNVKDAAACAEFRHFWGDVSNLRRFRDSSMSEAVVWPEPSQNRHPSAVLADIAQYVLQRHLGLSCWAVLDRDLNLAANIPSNCDAVAASVTAAYSQLRAQLRSLPDMPLQISSISSCSSVLRRCQLCHTAQVTGQGLPGCDPMIYRDLVPVVVQFESSARWPEDLNAISRIKTAILIRLAASLREQNVTSATAFPDWCLVWCDGVAFRVAIYHTREMAIRRTERDITNVTKTMDPRQNASELVEMERDLVQRPLLATELFTQCQQFVTLPPTVRLLKRWLNSHLISDLFDDEVLELLVCSVFLEPAPFSTPASSSSAFCQVLRLICSHDWKNLALIVDLHGDLTPDQRSEMQTRFLNEKGRGAMRVATLRDLSSSMWKSPSLEALRRVKSIAQSALDHIISVFDSPFSNLISLKTAFKAPLSHYDIFIKLDPRFVPYREYALLSPKLVETAVNGNFKPAVPSSKAILEMLQKCSAGVNPVQILIDCLRSAFANVVTFSVDSIGSDLIVGKVIRVKNREPGATFRNRNLSYMKPIEGDRIDINMDQIISDIRRFGDGIVLNVFTDVKLYRNSS